MFNVKLARESASKTRPKSIYAGNKSHTTSMNIRISQDFSETPLKNISNKCNEGREEKSKSTKKYKHSIVLQDNTIHLMKKENFGFMQKRPSKVPETERMSRESIRYKRSIDHPQQFRMKTDVNEESEEQYKPQITEVTVDELKLFVKKFHHLKKHKLELEEELKFYKKHFKNEICSNSIIKILKE